MREIELIEAVVERPYGKVPQIFENSLRGRYQFFRKAYGHSKYRSVALSLLQPLTNLAAYYEPHAHAILTAGNQLSNSLRNLILLHELAHAYVHSKNPQINEREIALLSDERSYQAAGKRIPRKLVKARLAAHAIQEGLAEYIAIEAQKLAYSTSQESVDLYWQTRESILLNFGQSTNRSGQSSSASLDENNIEELLRLCAGAIAYRSDIDVKVARKGKVVLNELGYPLGYYFIRSCCEATDTTPADELDEIIMQPPLTFDSLVIRLGRNFRKITPIEE